MVEKSTYGTLLKNMRLKMTGKSFGRSPKSPANNLATPVITSDRTISILSDLCNLVIASAANSKS